MRISNEKGGKRYFDTDERYLECMDGVSFENLEATLGDLNVVREGVGEEGFTIKLTDEQIVRCWNHFGPRRNDGEGHGLSETGSTDGIESGENIPRPSADRERPDVDFEDEDGNLEASSSLPQEPPRESDLLRQKFVP